MTHETDKLLPWFLGNAGIEAYHRASHYVVLDFETTNLDNGSATNPENSIVLACWIVVKDGKAARKYKFGDEYELQELVDDVNAADFIVAHNAKFELQWLSRCGVDTRSVLVYDTMSSEWVIQGNRKVLYNLDATAKRYKIKGKLSFVSTLIKGKISPAIIPRSWLLDYCWIDVDVCHQLMHLQFKEIDNLDVWHLVLQRNLVVPVLADIEMQGLTLDRERVLREEERLQQVLETVGAQLDEITGGINLNSTKQLADLLYDKLGFEEARDNAGEVMKTPAGAPSTSADAISRLITTNEEQERFVKLYKEYNQANTLLTKNVAFFKNICLHRNNRFYGQLNQCRTANHRLASSGVRQKFRGPDKVTKKGIKETWVEMMAQIQNLPRQYKPLFTSDHDEYLVTEYDGSQIEFRVAAELGHDEVAESDIVNGVDIHSFTRDTMNEAYKRFGIDKEIDRQGAKPNTFAPMYGAIGKDKAEQEYAQAFRNKYKGIFGEQTRWTLTVADRKQLTTPYGLTFYWPNVKMHRSGYVSFSTEIFNLPISGFATGEIIPLALVHFWHRIRDTRARIFNTVHDSIIVYNHKDEIDYVTEIAKLSMTHDVYRFLREVYRYEFRVPLGFGMKTGTHWSESKTEHKWDVWPQGWERKQTEQDKVTVVEYDTRPEEVKRQHEPDTLAAYMDGDERYQVEENKETKVIYDTRKQEKQIEASVH